MRFAERANRCRNRLGPETAVHPWNSEEDPAVVIGGGHRGAGGRDHRRREAGVRPRAEGPGRDWFFRGVDQRRVVDRVVGSRSWCWIEQIPRKPEMRGRPAIPQGMPGRAPCEMQGGTQWKSGCCHHQSILNPPIPQPARAPQFRVPGGTRNPRMFPTVTARPVLLKYSERRGIPRE